MFLSLNPSFNKYKIPVPEVCLSLYFLGNVLQQINRINESVVRAKKFAYALNSGRTKSAQRYELMQTHTN